MKTAAPTKGMRRCSQNPSPTRRAGAAAWVNVARRREHRETKKPRVLAGEQASGAWVGEWLDVVSTSGGSGLKKKARRACPKQAQRATASNGLSQHEQSRQPARLAVASCAGLSSGAVKVADEAQLPEVSSGKRRPREHGGRGSVCYFLSKSGHFSMKYRRTALASAPSKIWRYG